MTADDKIVEAVARAIYASPVFQPAYGPWQEGSNRAAQQHARVGARAAITAYQAEAWQGEETEFEVWQDGMPVAGTSGARETALREAMHYAAVYGQDGPVSVCEVVRLSVGVSSPPPPKASP